MSTTIAWDTETRRFRAGKKAPELACVTWQEAQENTPHIEHWSKAEGLFESWLSDKDCLLVGHNVAYDMGVVCAQFPQLIPAVFRAYEDNRVTDTMVRQRMIDIARGCYRGYPDRDGVWRKLGYSLMDLTRRHTGKILKKDGWRLRYGEFRDLPLDQWVKKAEQLQKEALKAVKAGSTDKDLQAIILDVPEQVLLYALEDATSTLSCFLAQEEDIKFLHDQYRQTRGEWALHLSATWGLRTRALGIQQLEQQTKDAILEIKKRLVSAGLIRTNGTRDTKKAKQHMLAVCEREGLVVRKTKKDGICLDSDACEATDDPLLGDYADFSKLNKTLTSDIPLLTEGIKYPIHCSYGVAESGRSTCAGPNIQNLRSLPGIREAFIPRPGYCFIQADFPQLELYTLAQTCVTLLGESALAVALNGGLDPHTAFAATLLNVSYEEAVVLRKAGDKTFDLGRKLGKVNNFGRPGGLGDARLVEFAARAPYNMAMTEEEAKSYKHTWFQTWPEMRKYFAMVNQLCAGGEATVVLPQTSFVRGGAKYCAACNTFFQGLGAACAKNAMWLVAKAQYTQPQSPLFGCRTVAFVHDEIIAECPIGQQHEAAFELGRVMVEGANVFLPDVPIPFEKMEPTAMAWWSKEAKQEFKDGRLQIWAGKKES